jgi:hypothetical protein
VVAIAESSGSSRRASAQGRAEPPTQTLKRQRPSTHLMRSQSEAKPPRARAGHGSSVVSRSRNAQQTADASDCSMTQRVNRDKTPSSDPRQTSYSMTWRSAGCAAPSAPRGSYSMETSRLRWRVLRTTLMRPATCAAGCAALPTLSSSGERVSHVNRRPALRECAAEAAPSAGGCGSRREHDGILRNAGIGPHGQAIIQAGDGIADAAP